MDKPYSGECPNGCIHTELEHYAFDRGVRDGEAGIDDDACPYTRPLLEDAWLTGHSVGSLTRQEAETKKAQMFAAPEPSTKTP